MLKTLLRLLVSCSFVFCGSAAAHEIRPAIATMTLAPDGRYEIAISVNLEAVIAGVGPQHRDTDDSPNAGQYNGLRASAPEALRKVFSAEAGRYLEGIEIGFDGARAKPVLSGVEIPAVGEVA